VKHKQIFKSNHSTPIFAVLFALIVSACSTYDNLSLDDINVFSDPAPIYCPSISILANAERITLFKDGPGRDIIDITTEALIDDFRAKCTNQVDQDTYIGSVRVELSLGYTASRGPANVDGKFSIPYFVSVLDLQKNVLNKVNFTINDSYGGNRYRVTDYDEVVTLTIPVAPPLSGGDFLIYIGFQLTPEQMIYNKHSG
jgi:hypothetical protein